MTVVGGIEVPEVSRFFGIVITMNYWDHAPPHFHASYGSEEATVSVRDPRVLEGRLGPRARRMVLEWARRHTAQLSAWWNWAQDPAGSPRPQPIPPLE